MGKELVRYESGHPVFTEAVTEFASVLHPLLGFANLAAKVHAWRIESKRLKFEETLAQHDHRERMEINKLQAKAIERQTDSIKELELARVAVDYEALRLADKSDIRRMELAREMHESQIHHLERSLEVAIRDIHIAGETSRYAIDQSVAVEFRRIDIALQLGLSRLALEQHAVDETLRHHGQRARSIDRSRREIEQTLHKTTQLMVREPDFREIAAFTVGSLSRSLALMQQRDHDAITALTTVLGRPEGEP